MLLVSSNARSSGGDPLAQHRAAIDAAQAAGVGPVLYTSHMAAAATSAFPPMADHVATEAMLATSGLRWTSLRNGFYAASAMMMMGDARTTGVLSTPETGPVSWTTHDELAAAAATILLDEGRFDGPTPPLVGSETLTLAELAARTIPGLRIVPRSDDEHREKLLARGLPPGAVAIAMGFFVASRRGEFASSDTTLRDLLAASR